MNRVWIPSFIITFIYALDNIASNVFRRKAEQQDRVRFSFW